MRRALRRIAVGALVAVVLAASVAGVAWYGINARGPLATEKTVVIPSGAGLMGIAERLAEAGVVRDAWLLLIAAQLEGATRSLRAGEYAFPPGISAAGVVGMLRGGQTVVRRITIPEGLTSAQILNILANEPALAGDLPPTPPEGSLLPETYHFSHGDSRKDLVERMQRNMREALAELWAKRSERTPVRTPEEAVTLASIIEKETGVAQERARVAGVFANRLEKGMRLQSDPTVVYALTQGKEELGRSLTRADTRVESPYNTYVVAGLPPGPIANPGRASLEAALHPEEHDYLYFVADGNGGHAFGKTLREHNRNVSKWRAVQRQRQREAESDQ